MSSPPVSNERLEQITVEACEKALSGAESYIHSQTESWNTTIINTILESLVTTGASSTTTSSQYKYAVNSTIIQHLGGPSTNTSTTQTTQTQTVSPPSSPAPEGDMSVKPSKGRRGMHSATGAYWNNDTDGMWSFKWEGSERKGMDVVVSILWVAV